jgi:hypothetical protein
MTVMMALITPGGRPFFNWRTAERRTIRHRKIVAPAHMALQVISAGVYNSALSVSVSHSIDSL